MRLKGWISSGKEAWIYPAKTPDDLQGEHCDLMASRMRKEDRVRYLLYSPMWEGTKACFGIRGQQASHGVAVMEDRFLISRNEHRKGRPPAVIEIPFDRVLTVELGSALLLGWFVVRYVDGHAVVCYAVLHGARGREYFAEAVQEYRCITCGDLARRRQMATRSTAELWAIALPDLTAKLKAVLIDGECILDFVYTRELWAKAKKRWRTVPVALVAPSVLVATDRGVLLAQRESASKPDSMNFAVNVICISDGAIRAVTLDNRTAHGIPYRALQLVVGRDPTAMPVDIPLSGVAPKVAASFANVLERKVGHGYKG